MGRAAIKKNPCFATSSGDRCTPPTPNYTNHNRGGSGPFREWDKAHCCLSHHRWQSARASLPPLSSLIAKSASSMAPRSRPPCRIFCHEYVPFSPAAPQAPRPLPGLRVLELPHPSAAVRSGHVPVMRLGASSAASSCYYLRC